MGPHSICNAHFWFTAHLVGSVLQWPAYSATSARPLWHLLRSDTRADRARRLTNQLIILDLPLLVRIMDSEPGRLCPHGPSCDRADRWSARFCPASGTGHGRAFQLP